MPRYRARSGDPCGKRAGELRSRCHGARQPRPRARSGATQPGARNSRAAGNRRGSPRSARDGRAPAGPPRRSQTSTPQPHAVAVAPSQNAGAGGLSGFPGMDLAAASCSCWACSRSPDVLSRRLTRVSAGGSAQPPAAAAKGMRRINPTNRRKGQGRPCRAWILPVDPADDPPRLPLTRAASGRA